MPGSLTVLPRTPPTARLFPVHHDHHPAMSSPLASSPTTSPHRASLDNLQKRRRSQFKSREVSCRTPGAKAHLSSQRVAPIPFALTPGRTNPNLSDTNGQAEFLRARFKAMCFERARQTRQRNIDQKRSFLSHLSSDGADVDVEMDAKNDDGYDGLFDDELFQRIVANEKRRRLHAYALSYELDVGSSFDPDMEDATEWEKYLQGDFQVGSRADAPGEDAPPPDALDEFEFECDVFDAIDEYGQDSTWIDDYIARIPDNVLIEAQNDQNNSSRMPSVNFVSPTLTIMD